LSGGTGEIVRFYNGVFGYFVDVKDVIVWEGGVFGDIGRLFLYALIVIFGDLLSSKAVMVA